MKLCLLHTQGQEQRDSIREKKGGRIFKFGGVTFS